MERNKTKLSRPHGKLQIINVVVNALFDTGSTITLLSGETYDRFWPKPTLKKMEIPIRAAQGSQMDVRGIMTETVTARGGSVKMIRPFVVVNNLSSECIIGMDTIKEEGIEIDLPNRKIIYPHQENTYDCYSVYASRKTIIAPWEERIVYGNCNVIIGPNESLMINENDKPPLCFSEVIHRQKGRIPIVMANPTEWPVEIVRGQKIAEGQKVSNDQLLPFEQISTIPEGKTKMDWSRIPQDVLNDIPKEWVSRYREMLSQFSDIFSMNPDDVGHCKDYPQRIMLKNEKEIANTPPYRIPHHLLEIAHNYINKLLKAGIIRPSTSPFSSPLLLVKKPGVNDPNKSLVEQYRVVHDYRLLNLNIIPDSYPLYHIYDLIDRVAQAKIWSVIDLSSGFFNQNLEESSRKYTAFGLPGLGHYEYTRSAQGLCNSPASFQRMLDGVIRGLNNCFVYIDDVVVASQSHEEHLADLSNVFSRFQKYNIKCRLGKLQLGSPQVTYLGYDISKKDGIRPGIIKSKVIRHDFNIREAHLIDTNGISRTYAITLLN